MGYRIFLAGASGAIGRRLTPILRGAPRIHGELLNVGTRLDGFFATYLSLNSWRLRKKCANRHYRCTCLGFSQVTTMCLTRHNGIFVEPLRARHGPL
jgi:hypothetical protein